MANRVGLVIKAKKNSNKKPPENKTDNKAPQNPETTQGAESKQ